MISILTGSVKALLSRRQEQIDKKLSGLRLIKWERSTDHNPTPIIHFEVLWGGI